MVLQLLVIVVSDQSARVISLSIDNIATTYTFSLSRYTNETLVDRFHGVICVQRMMVAMMDNSLVPREAE